MRLTLRTLLAYLDDILEPSQTKEIGNKLGESKFASDLVERIRDVMRRRRLTAPEIEGGAGSLDANTMAEYLDNTLAPEKVTDIEKRCLESDMHLAEAAACHQILTMVLGEPVDISPDSRRRMYGLVSQGSGDDHAAVAARLRPTAAETDGDEIDELAAMPQVKDETETIGSALPDYLKQRPFWQRALTVIAPAVLIGVFILLILPDHGINPYKWINPYNWFGTGNQATPMAGASGEGPAAEPAAKNKGPTIDLPKAVDATKVTSPTKSAKSIAATEGTPGDGGKLLVNPTTASTPGGGSQEQKPADQKLPEQKQAEQKIASGSTPTAAAGGTKPTAKATSQEVGKEPAKNGPPSGTAVAIVAPRPVKPAPDLSTVKAEAKAGTVPAPPKPGDTAPSVAPPEVHLASKSGVLIGYDSARDDWFVLERPGMTLPVPGDAAPEGKIGNSPPSNVQVPSPPVPRNAERRTDQLVAPEPFDNRLEFGDGLCQVWLLGGTSVRLLEPTGNARFGIQIREGKVVIRSGGSNLPGTPYQPLTIALQLADELVQIELLRPESQCGIEIVPGFPTRPGQDAKEIGFFGGLYVVSGDVRFTEAVGRQRTLTAGRWISLAPGDRSVATDLSGSAFRPKGSPLLAWLFPESRRMPSAYAKVAREFEGEFIADQPVSLTISTVAKNARNAKTAELAVRTLALTNQYTALVGVLAQVVHEEAVHAAANGLRGWLPQSPANNNALLQKELSTAFEPGTRSVASGLDDRDVIIRLLWGYNKDDARDRKTSNQLVEWLDHDKLAIRVLAIDQIHDLTGQNFRYRAAGPVGDRKQYKKVWERYVERYKGLLPQ